MGVKARRERSLARNLGGSIGNLCGAARAVAESKAWQELRTDFASAGEDGPGACRLAGMISLRLDAFVGSHSTNKCIEGAKSAADSKTVDQFVSLPRSIGIEFVGGILCKKMPSII